MTFDEFIKAYERKLSERGGGATIKFSPRHLHAGHPKKAADSFVQSLHFRPLGEHWIDLDWDIRGQSDKFRGDPSGHLAALLERTMAYREPWFDPQEAKRVSTDFYRLFNVGKTVRLTNRVGESWDPITKSTFDAAYIVMDDESIGIICIEDED